MNILVFFAHPDDETMLCGGLLALLSKSGHDVHYLSCTRGEGGECGVPPLCSQTQLGSLRELELNCAVEKLGGKTLQFLNYVDPLVGPENTLFSFTQDQEKLAMELKECIKKKDIDLLISHGSNGEYGHPGHLTVYQAVQKIIQNEFPEMFWYTVQAYYDNSPKPHLLNKADQADWIIDVSSMINEKVRAALCHKSQHDLFVRKKSKESGKSVNVAQVIQTEESYHFANGTHDILKNLPEIKKNLIDLKVRK
ncbi:MAG: PIG-L family deacetylase [Anaerolineaceae bacterium]|nr:PIG-L family deacetylase [Anaerolineaceae bacterium]